MVDPRAEATPQSAFRFGFVALVGRPNVGKSTLLNTLVGDVVTIVTHWPQTTRRRIRGILNRPNSQIVLVDTPGIAWFPGKTSRTGRQQQALNRFMLAEARAALAEVDLTVLLVECKPRKGFSILEEDRLVFESIRSTGGRKLLAINKIDLLKKKEWLLPLIAAYDATGLFGDVIPLSALTGDGIERLISVIEAQLPKGHQYFPPDMITDQPERFLVAEYIREQVLLHTTQEIPYRTAVEVMSFEEIPDRRMICIQAVIFVERNSQKGIIIGKGGRKLKLIGSEARRPIERMLDCRVYLDLRVRVESEWSRTRTGLRSVGYEIS